MTSSTHRLGVLLLVYAAFVSLGLPDGILGAAWPSLRATFGVELNDNWRLLALGTCGSALSNFASGVALRRLGVGRVLVVTTLMTSVVILGYSLGPTFAIITALAFFLGLGNGAVDAGLNHFAASHLSSRHMSWLHAFWGVGVSLGTLTVSAVMASGGSWRRAYLVVGLVQLALALAFISQLRLLPGAPAAPAGLHHAAGGVELRSTLKQPAAWTNMATFFVYCGLECGAGLWIPSVLHDGRGWSTEAAGLMATVYWGSLTVGRFLIGAVAHRFRPARIARAAALGALVGALLLAASSAVVEQAAAASVLTALGLLVTGLSVSPIYPMLMHDTARAAGAGHAVNLIGMQGGSGQLGFTLLPIAIGALLQAYSTEWLGASLSALALLLLALLALRERFAQARVSP